MKQQQIHQELLVFTTTSVSRIVLHVTNNNDNNENMSVPDKLEHTCRVGLLKEMFPKIIGLGIMPFPKMFIWGIYRGKSYLLIDLADRPAVIDPVFSIDPYLVLPELILN